MQRTIGAILSEYQFSIPSYQRDYAWGKENFNDLWNDLQEALDSKNEGHFLGTIVVAPNTNNTEDSKRLDIIDGQQRLTTIFMLLYALAQKSQHKDRHKIKYLIDEKNTFNLKVTEKNREFFKNLLTHVENDTLSPSFRKEADTQGQKNLYDVCEEITYRIKTIQKETIEDYINTLLYMNLMWLMESDSGRAIRTFQSVNDRGVQLTLLEKLKSLLIYYSNLYCDGAKNGLDSQINDRFGKIYENLEKIKERKNIKGNDMFRYHIGSKKFSEIAYLGYYDLSNDNAYKNLKNELKKLSQECITAKDFTKLKSFLESYTQDLAAFYAAFLRLLERIDTDSAVFQLFMLERVSSYFYNSLVRLEMDNALDTPMLQLIAKADILYFRTGSKWRSDAYNLIQAYWRGKEEFKKAIIKKCKNSGKTEDVIKNLKETAYEMSCYHYVFFMQNCQDMNIDSLIEFKKTTQQQDHIIPRNVLDTKNAELARKYGFKGDTDEEVLEDLRRLRHSYGNLVSLEEGLNKGAGAKESYGKAEYYKHSKIPFVKQFDIANFNKSALVQRNNEFEKWAEKFFEEFK